MKIDFFDLFLQWCDTLVEKHMNQSPIRPVEGQDMGMPCRGQRSVRTRDNCIHGKYCDQKEINCAGCRYHHHITIYTTGRVISEKII